MTNTDPYKRLALTIEDRLNQFTQALRADLEMAFVEEGSQRGSHGALDVFYAADNHLDRELRLYANRIAGTLRANRLEEVAATIREALNP